MLGASQIGADAEQLLDEDGVVAHGMVLDIRPTASAYISSVGLGRQRSSTSLVVALCWADVARNRIRDRRITLVARSVHIGKWRDWRLNALGLIDGNGKPGWCRGPFDDEVNESG